MQAPTAASPDPSPLTTAQILREVENVKNLIEYRLDGMDTATKLLHDNVTRFPTEVDKQISHARDLTDVKFHSIQTQFSERNTRFRDAEEAAKIAINAALDTQKEAAAARNESNKEAIAKSEAATTKQIDGIHVLLASSTKAFDEKIASITARLDRGEGRTRGLGDGWGYLAGTVGLLVAVGTLVLTVMRN